LSRVEFCRYRSRMKGSPLNHEFNLNEDKPIMSVKELTDLGNEKVAYVRSITSQEVMEKFPSVEGLQPGMVLWALFSASGDPLAIADEPAGVLSNAMELDLCPVSLH
jgi:hypothetical protein